MPAVAGIAALDVVAVAAVALLLAVALFPLFRPIVQGGLSQVPIIGGWLSGNADLVLFRAYVSALSWIGSAISPLEDAVRRVRLALVLWTGGAVVTAGALAVKLWQLAHLVLPQLQAALVQYAQALFGQAIAYAQVLVGQAIAYAQALFRQAVEYAQVLAAQAIAYAQALSAQDLAYARALFAQALQYTQETAAIEQLFTQQAVLGAEGYARQLAQDAVQYTQAAVLGAERYAQRLGADAEGYARALQGQALDYARAGDAAVAAAAAAATAGVAARVTDIEDSPCQRYCSPLGDLGQLLQGLEDAGLAAIMLALLAQATSDPQGLERELADFAGGPIKDAVAGLGLGIPG